MKHNFFFSVLAASTHLVTSSPYPASAEAASVGSAGSLGGSIKFAETGTTSNGGIAGVEGGATHSIASILGTPGVGKDGGPPPNDGSIANVDRKDLPNPYNKTANFANLSAKPLACFRSGGSATLCLPPGTYNMSRSIYGFAIDEVRSLTMPASSSVKFVTGNTNMPNGSFDTNQTVASNPDFAAAIKAVSAQVPNYLPTVVIDIPVDYPCACIFNEENFKGQAWCFGEGEGILPQPFRDTAQSLTIHGKMTVKAYFDGSKEDADGEWVDNLTQNVSDFGTRTNRLGGLRIGAKASIDIS
ncbi:MAG: hypothetical protein M1825_005642 [Sarcosagium campestre]|nr:MAG: hypothetical protein M1825_005642 [Sarcosagium campestre]